MVCLIVWYKMTLISAQHLGRKKGSKFNSFYHKMFLLECHCQVFLKKCGKLDDQTQNWPYYQDFEDNISYGCWWIWKSSLQVYWHDVLMNYAYINCLKWLITVTLIDSHVFIDLFSLLKKCHMALIARLTKLSGTRQSTSLCISGTKSHNTWVQNARAKWCRNLQKTNIEHKIWVL